MQQGARVRPEPTRTDTPKGDEVVAIEQVQMQEYAKQWGQLVARTWSDEAFKQRLLAEPAAALAEQGIAVPPDVEVRVHENTAAVFHLTLPPKPSEELSDEQLDAVAGGDTAGSLGTAGTAGTITGCALCFSTLGTVGSVG
jgi:hypothetical protein